MAGTCMISSIRTRPFVYCDVQYIFQGALLIFVVLGTSLQLVALVARPFKRKYQHICFLHKQKEFQVLHKYIQLASVNK